jgi:hypothetical protein
MARRKSDTAESPEAAKKRLLGPFVKMEPLDTGITRGKLKLTFADGTQAIFKPARPSTSPPVVLTKEDTP